MVHSFYEYVHSNHSLRVIAKTFATTANFFFNVLLFFRTSVSNLLNKKCIFATISNRNQQEKFCSIFLKSITVLVCKNDKHKSHTNIICYRRRLKANSLLEEKSRPNANNRQNAKNLQDGKNPEKCLPKQEPKKRKKKLCKRRKNLD